MIADIVKGLIAPVTGLISEFIVDKDKANEIAFKISTLAANQAHDVTLAQLDINKEQAKSPSLFVSGGRPAALWVCVVALANNAIVVPYAQSFGLDVVVLSDGQLDVVLYGLLGLGTVRTIEKVNKVARVS
jgi:hypothetical protein